MSNKKIKPQTRYEVITQEDPETGDLFIPIPPEILKEMGWKEGTEVKFDVDKDGTIYVTKK